MGQEKGGAMKTTLLIAAAALLSAGPALGQMQWTDFQPSQSRVKFDPPGLSAQPTRAFEGINLASTKRNVRNFGYIFNRTGGDPAFAQVYLFSIAAEATYFTDAPNFDGLMLSFYQDFKGQTISWIDQQRVKAPSPIGTTEYRRFSGLGKSCTAFGGLYGRSSTHGFNSAASGTSGTEQLMGFYCAAKGHVLSDEDVKLVLSRLSIEGLGKAQGPGLHRFPDAPAKTASSGSDAAVAATTAGSRKVIVLWEGRSGALSGTLLMQASQTAARLEVQLPGYDKYCSGVSTWDKSDSGTWAIGCPDGTTGSGIYRPAGGSGGYVGEGTDNKGARITFSVDAKT